MYWTPYFKGNDIVIDIENRWPDGKFDFFKRRFHLEFLTSAHLLDQRGNFRSRRNRAIQIDRNRSNQLACGNIARFKIRPSEFEAWK